MIALDTNVLIYALGDHPFGEIARGLVVQAPLHGGCLPVHVLSEFASVCRKKALVEVTEIEAHLNDLSASFRVAPVTVEHVVSGLAIAERYRLQFFDALICASARDYGARTILTEDMHDGLKVGALTIVNPFVEANREIVEGLLSD